MTKKLLIAGLILSLPLGAVWYAYRTYQWHKRGPGWWA